MSVRKITASVLAVLVLVTSFPVFSLESYAEENKTDVMSEENMTEQSEIEPTEEIQTEEPAAEEWEEEQETIEIPSEEPGSAETASEDSAGENAEGPQTELRENSWRYANGEPFEMMTRSAVHPDAWKKVNGRYVNSKGDPIPGAQLKGVDVSVHQGRIDWERAKADGVEFAIIRCGYGNDYASQDDAYWEYNVSECERLGIPYGVYLYSYATNTEMAASEADHVLRLIRGKNLSYPVYYDLEDNTTMNAGNEMIGMIAQTFCDKISSAGYRVGIYANLNWHQNYLTSPVFDNPNWSNWIAQYNYQCDFTEPYDIWQCTSKGTVDGISGYVDLNFTMTPTSDLAPVVVEDQGVIQYSTHQQTYGWTADVANGYQSGVTGYEKRIEGFRIKVGSGYGDLGVRYRAHCQTYGWMNWVSGGELAGTEGQSKAVQAVRMELTGTEAAKYDIYYRVHCQTYGWSTWAVNGAPSGTQGYGKRIEALQIAVVKKGTPAPAEAPGNMGAAFLTTPTGVNYKTYVAGQGWTSTSENGAESGTTGQCLPLEGLKVQINGGLYSGQIKYNTYMQTYGWQNDVTNNTEAGLPGQGKRMEAIKIWLEGEVAEHYDIYYRVHTQRFGWLDWAKNGEMSGTAKYARRIESVQIQLVEKGAAAPGNTVNSFREAKVSYSTHCQTYGWKSTVYDGETSGTTGEAKRLEAIKISFPYEPNQEEIQYQVHMQKYGWQSDWTTGGNLAGTTGEAKRLEAIRIKLTGSMEEKYDVYYRVHAQTYGWLGWAKNGEPAGSEGLAKRLEAIEVILVEKGGNAPGDTANSFVSK